MTLACVLRSGGHYTVTWVRKLARAVVAATMHAPHLVCLTDQPGAFGPRDPVRAVPLLHDWPGWWAKLEVWRPGLFSGPVVYMDLDTLVLGAVDGLWAKAGPLAMLRDFYAPTRPASGVMTWHTDHDPPAYLYRQAVQHGVGRPRARLDHWVEAHLRAPPRPLQDLHPGVLVSLKAHARAGPPPGAAVVCAHGTPGLHQPTAGWAHDRWMEL